MVKVYYFFRKIIKKMAGFAEYERLKRYLASHKKICLLISHEMSLTGAPLLLLKVGIAIKKAGYNPVVVSISNGEAKREFVDKQVPVFITYGFERIYDLLNSSHYELILFNSIASCSWISKFNDNHCRKYLWLHEGRTYVSKYADDFRRTDLSDVEVLAVSENVKEACISESLPLKSYTIVPFGFEDEWAKHSAEIKRYRREKKGKYTISIIGTVTERKNQVQLFRVIKNLYSEIKKEISVRVVGSADGDYAQGLKEYSSFLDTVFTGSIASEKIYKEYMYADLVVNCATDDTGPMVIPEAMMYHTRVLVSSGCGMHSYLKKVSEKLVYEVNDDNDLADKIICAYNEKESNHLEEACYELFKKEFDQEIFESRLEDILELQALEESDI